MAEQSQSQNQSQSQGQNPSQTQGQKQGQRQSHSLDPDQMGVSEKRIVGILGSHLGRFNAIRMGKLAVMVGIKPRKIRETINHLKFFHCLPIMSWDHPKHGGYYLPEDGMDRQMCVDMFMARIFHHLKNIAALEKISVVEAAEIFNIELEKKATEPNEEIRKAFMGGLPVPPEGYTLVTALVKHAQENPDKYHRDLNSIQNMLGAKFIERSKLRKLADLRWQLNSICSELEN